MSSLDRNVVAVGVWCAATLVVPGTATCRLTIRFPLPPAVLGKATGSLLSSVPAAMVAFAEPPNVTGAGAASVAAPVPVVPAWAATVAASTVSGTVESTLDNRMRACAPVAFGCTIILIV
ncbi:MAG TPA: hypothetical protein VGN81_37520 [Pseudonocardiaceae bacterium]